MYIYLHTYIHIFNICVHTYIDLYTHTYLHTFTHIYTHLLRHCPRTTPLTRRKLWERTAKNSQQPVLQSRSLIKLVASWVLRNFTSTLSANWCGVTKELDLKTLQKVKRLARKCIGTRKQLFWGTQKILPHRVLCYSCPCLFDPAHGLLKVSRTFGFKPVLGRPRSILWGFSAILNFWDSDSNLLLFLLSLEICIFWRASFSLIKNLKIGITKILQIFWRPCYIIVTPHELREHAGRISPEAEKFSSKLIFDNFTSTLGANCGSV